MLGFGAIFRFLVLVLCLVPFTSSQQATGALAPILPLVPTPAGEFPAAPANENEEEEDGREDPDAKERHAPHSRHCPPLRELVATLHPARASHQTHLIRPRTTTTVPADWCRNGLGTPYRC